MNKIDHYNRDIVIERYVDDIVGGMHFLDIKEKLKDCLIREKHEYSNSELEIEIMRHDPGLITDIYIEELMGEVSHA
jgi:hypothetical protein